MSPVEMLWIGMSAAACTEAVSHADFNSQVTVLAACHKRVHYEDEHSPAVMRCWTACAPTEDDAMHSCTAD